MVAQPAPLPAPVRLRPAVARDAPLLAAWREEASVRRYQPLQLVSIPELRADLERQRGNDLERSRGERFQWIVLVGDEPAGWMTLAVTSWEQGVAELGYALTSAVQGQGVMSRMLPAFVTEVFRRSRLDRLEARCAVANGASRRVLERSGFQREGLLRSYFRLGGERVDSVLYALLRRDLHG